MKVGIFDSEETLKNAGFDGFVRLTAFRKAFAPTDAGVYMVLRSPSLGDPTFLKEGTADRFNGVSPNVEVHELKRKWVNETPVLYIGCSKNVRDRLAKLLRYGTSRERRGITLYGGRFYDADHSGGRYLWQVKDSPEYCVCWKSVYPGHQNKTKKDLLRQFKLEYGNLPYANLKMSG